MAGESDDDGFAVTLYSGGRAVRSWTTHDDPQFEGGLLRFDADSDDEDGDDDGDEDGERTVRISGTFVIEPLKKPKPPT